MANNALSRLERMYVTKETAYGTVVSPANGDYCNHIKLNMSNKVNLLRPRDKTGSRSHRPGIRGRVNSVWDAELSIKGSSTPNADIYLQMLFGQAPTSGAYTLSDSIISGDIWSYRSPSTLEQRVSLGSILQQFEFTLGADIFEAKFSGIGKYMLGSSHIAAADSEELGGLVTFPAEPGAPVDAGAFIIGFTGALTVDGITAAFIKGASIKGNTGNQLVLDDFGNFYPKRMIGAERDFTFGFRVADDDSVGVGTLKDVADSKALISAVCQIGTVTGNIYTFTVSGLQLESNSLDDSTAEYVATFPDSPAAGTTLTALNELALAIT